jgi:hypothetical protein
MDVILVACGMLIVIGLYLIKTARNAPKSRTLDIESLGKK